MAVDFRKWFSELTDGVKRGDKRAVFRALYKTYLGSWYTLSSRMDFGTNVFATDWDALIILDACRVDAMKEVAPEYDFLGDVSSIWSVGSTSPEWIVNTFDRQWIDTIRETGYVTANAYSQRILADRYFPPDHNTVPFAVPNWNVACERDLAFIEHSWTYGHDEDLGNVDPEAVTNSAIYNSYKRDSERIIVHYQQPHTPYMGRAKPENRALTDVERSPLVRLQAGADRDEIWDLYKDNLRLALNEVEVLLNNTDFEKVIITADHGDAFGEWSFYGHIGGFLHPCVRKVPWVETSSSNELSDDVAEREVTRPPTQTEDVSTEQRLHDLGYID